MSFKRSDYPLAETQPGVIKGQRGIPLSAVTLEAVLSGRVSMEDLRITPAALTAQAEIARDSGRPRLAENFERAAELVNVPQDFVMEVYELLRPGRAKDKQHLLAAAATLRDVHGARLMAAFVEEAADTYAERGLFTYRF
jgi:glycerol dehydratase small subunit/propanediol dehydratase small subunit